MGWDCRTIEVIVSLDRHGDERQQLADELFAQLAEEIRRVVEQEKYKPLSPSLR